MNPLAARKRLLIAESELNRAQLASDVEDLMTGFRALKERTRAARSVASSTAGLIAGLAAVQRDKRLKAALKPTRLQKALHYAGFLSSLWLAYRERSGSRK